MTAEAPLTLDHLLRLVDQVPATDTFPTVDEVLAGLRAVAAAHPELTQWRRIGTSRLGEPLQVLTVGRGTHQAVIFAGVHPNEPIGGATALHLARTLVDNEELRLRLDYTWHIVGCIDPDGMRLNEGWFAGPFDRRTLGRHFYRPPFDEQVAWTFPLAYQRLYFDQVLPETMALMRLFDETRPAFICGLHNAELGGAYYFLSEEAPALYPALHAIPRHLGVPLHAGEPELPFLPRYDLAVFGDIKVEDQYDYAEGLGLDPTTSFIDAGTSPNAYVEKYGSFSLVAELPYWTSAEASDTSASSTSYAQVIGHAADNLDEIHRVLSGVLVAVQPELALDTPFLRAVRPFVAGLPQQIDQDRRRAALPGSKRNATVAEVFSAGDAVHSARMRYGGMTLRLLEAETRAGLARPAVRRQHDRMQSVFDDWATAADAAMTATTLPIRNVVGVQYGAILAAADHAARRGPS